MPKARRPLGCLHVLLLFAVLVLAVWLLRAHLMAALGSALVEDDRLEKADVAVVLGGDDAGTRIVKAAQLAEAGYVPYVLVDGPTKLIGLESDMTIEFARRKGFPDSLFRPLPLPEDVNYTRGEEEFLGKYLKVHHIRKILLITSNFHTRRAARLMRKENPWLQTVVVAAPDPSFTPDGWWKSRDGQKTFMLEWLKTAAAWLGL